MPKSQRRKELRLHKRGSSLTEQFNALAEKSAAVMKDYLACDETFGLSASEEEEEEESQIHTTDFWGCEMGGDLTGSRGSYDGDDHIIFTNSHESMSPSTVFSITEESVAGPRATRKSISEQLSDASQFVANLSLEERRGENGGAYMYDKLALKAANEKLHSKARLYEAIQRTSAHGIINSVSASPEAKRAQKRNDGKNGRGSFRSQPERDKPACKSKTQNSLMGASANSSSKKKKKERKEVAVEEVESESVLSASSDSYVSSDEGKPVKLREKVKLTKREKEAGLRLTQQREEYEQRLVDLENERLEMYTFLDGLPNPDVPVFSLLEVEEGVKQGKIAFSPSTVSAASSTVAKERKLREKERRRLRAERRERNEKEGLKPASKGWVQKQKVAAKTMPGHRSIMPKRGDKVK